MNMLDQVVSGGSCGCWTPLPHPLSGFRGLLAGKPPRHCAIIPAWVSFFSMPIPSITSQLLSHHPSCDSSSALSITPLLTITWWLYHYRNLSLQGPIFWPLTSLLELHFWSSLVSLRLLNPFLLFITIFKCWFLLLQLKVIVSHNHSLQEPLPPLFLGPCVCACKTSTLVTSVPAFRQFRCNHVYHLKFMATNL